MTTRSGVGLVIVLNIVYYLIIGHHFQITALSRDVGLRNVINYYSLVPPVESTAVSKGISLNNVMTYRLLLQ